MPERTDSWKRDSGQATVEFVALIPVLLMLGWSVWQAALAGLTAEKAARTAHEAARAQAIGGAPAKSADRLLRKRFAQSAKITRTGTKVTVKLEVPSVIPGLHLGTVSATAAFPRQS